MHMCTRTLKVTYSRDCLPCCSIDPLYIEDPFDFENNVGSTCFRIQQIVKVQQGNWSRKSWAFKCGRVNTNECCLAVLLLIVDSPLCNIVVVMRCVMQGSCFSCMQSYQSSMA